MKKANYKVIFNRRKKLTSEGTAQIQIECYLNRKRKYINTGIKIKPKCWNSKTNRINRNHEKYIELNRFINLQLRKIEDFELKIIEKGEVFKLSDLDSINISNIAEGKDFLAFCWEEVLSNPHVSKSTNNQHKLVLKKLEEFKKKISFADLNYSFVKEFDNFLKNKNLHINTVATYHKNFKVFINIAIKKGLFKQENYPYKDFKVKLVATNRAFLTKDEVDKIQSIVFTESTKSIEFVRDMFLFACYTGLRFSDVQGLKNEHVLIEDNEYYIKTKMNKTQDYIKLPISLLFDGKAINIVKKYKNGSFKDNIFPRISNQKANDKLKVIALVGQINKNLSFHIARHTFGTNLASVTADQFLIKELMGHSKIETSMIYIHTSQEQIKNKLRSVKW